jgi:hypothetical protein
MIRSPAEPGGIYRFDWPWISADGFSESKVRPVLALAVRGTYPNQVVTICYITSQIKRRDSTSIFVSPSYSNNLSFESRIDAARVFTVDANFLKSCIGFMESEILHTSRAAAKEFFVKSLSD